MFCSVSLNGVPIYSPFTGSLTVNKHKPQMDFIVCALKRLPQKSEHCILWTRQFFFFVRKRNHGLQQSTSAAAGIQLWKMNILEFMVIRWNRLANECNHLFVRLILCPVRNTQWKSCFELFVLTVERALTWHLNVYGNFLFCSNQCQVLSISTAFNLHRTRFHTKIVDKPNKANIVSAFIASSHLSKDKKRHFFCSI